MGDREKQKKHTRTLVLTSKSFILPANYCTLPGRELRRKSLGNVVWSLVFHHVYFKQ